MERKKNGFMLESNGKCFICLRESSPAQFSTIKQEPDSLVEPPTVSTYSIESLSRYLKMDKGNVFLEGEPIPPTLVDKVEQSNLSVELCAACSHLTQKFTDLYRQLEKTKMEIESCVSLIHRKLVEAEEYDKTEVFLKLNNPRDPSALDLKKKIVDALRTVAMQKCKSNMGVTKPRVKIQKLTLMKVKIVKLKLRSETTSGRNVDMLNENIKIEYPPYEVADDDDDTGNYSVGADSRESDSDMDQTYPKQPEKNLPTPTASTVPQKIAPKYTINPNTGRPRCGICGKTFCTTETFNEHYKSIHLNDRHLCKLCGKIFSQRTSLLRHHRGVHMHLKYKCSKCNAIYNWRARLTEHLQKSSCDAPNAGRHKCHLCSKAFLYKNKLNCHLECVHLQIRKYTCEICEMRFKQNGHLQKHRRTIHGGLYINQAVPQ